MRQSPRRDREGEVGAEGTGVRRRGGARHVQVGEEEMLEVCVELAGGRVPCDPVLTFAFSENLRCRLCVCPVTPDRTVLSPNTPGRARGNSIDPLPPPFLEAPKHFIKTLFSPRVIDRRMLPRACSSEGAHALWCQSIQRKWSSVTPGGNVLPGQPRKRCWALLCKALGLRRSCVLRKQARDLF
ncbi:hypothetical protein HJG60_008056 [Phyllostomus discolor]|uniref:Uncharacterized protein n=1 Tax=Phyllostomus discolor TaxID=89673 RepID=A0A834EVH7_9CHIR|nr:hypothetical protein HJG60_008056 [Phyllostomus discolor]